MNIPIEYQIPKAGDYFLFFFSQTSEMFIAICQLDAA